MRKLVFSVATLALAACGSSSNAIYIRAISAPSSSTCPGQSNGITTTITNEGAIVDSEIYLSASNTALLSLPGVSQAGTPVLLTGTQSGSTYTFSGKIIDDSTNNLQVITEENLTVTLTISGNAVTGTYVVQNQVTCESGCSGFTGNSNCTSSTAFEGTVIPGTQNQTAVGSQSASL
jgi:hypothetical protein